MRIRFAPQVGRAYVKVCEQLQGQQLEQFRREVARRFDEKITGEAQLATFDITQEDLIHVMHNKCLIQRPELLLR